ncbi:MAG: DUF6600 domain-containing protein [Candidatus Korobacteraceae bacterium]
MTARLLIAASILCSLLSLPLLAQTETQSGDPPDRTARLSYTEGAVSFEPAGEDNWSQASLNYPLTSGDRLWTDQDARAELETGNVAIRMSAETDLTTTSLADQLIQLGLAQGTLRVRSFDMQAGHEIEIDTPNAALTIVRPGDYRIDTFPDQNVTVVTVNQGELQITGNGLNQTVSSGQAFKLTGTNPVAFDSVAVAAPDSFDQWCAGRDQKYLNAKSRQYVSPYVPGYYDLDPYGSWEVAADYGPIWYPAGLPGGWCPYRYGRWVWVEPWGWTWLGQEAWGFAPYHYGRWVQIGPRWGWLPGPIVVAPVYAPAFVAFVGGAGFSVGVGVAAWFPLGPGEPFYPWYHHSDVYFRQINVTNVRNINMTNINVTNINNVHYRYQSVAATAVSANAFRNSEPVERNIVKVDPQQFARAQVIPHPEINPTARAIAAGTAATHPPVSAARPSIVQHAVAPGRVPVNETEARTPPPTERPAPQPPASNEANRVGPPTTRPPLVARTPPPPEKMPYSQKAPAMEEHPGRPLEPQQKQNLRTGQPAGPMRDQEFPPHAAPMPHSAPPPHGGKPKG